MLIILGVAATTVLICVNAYALADVLDDSALPASVARAWLTAITLVPGIGAMLWMRERGRIRCTAAAPALAPPAGAPYPSAAEILLLHEEIDRFRATQA